MMNAKDNINVKLFLAAQYGDVPNVLPTSLEMVLILTIVIGMVELFYSWLQLGDT